MCIEHSNYIISQIRYDGEGFMEPNAELRRQGALLISEGKKLIAKAIGLSEAESKDAPSVYCFYRMLLCAIKINNLKAAGEYLKRIVELDKKGAIAPYAKIVLDTNGGLYNEAGKALENLAKTKSPPANAFYYAAFIAFKTGDPKRCRASLECFRRLD